ncbi:hypothetical protein [Mucisphaera calidilacus]|uniref:Uncharacterized protein n=1 Tax=Mucisphaera calidilacus TaxID=2527982 RepID=A0A518BZC5_9BACT|nr:hypothetical protein [Mucisphaera calidilacus]QDU72327.1 hypothetical protein Pan265_21920 [Mucisphaera calidilacus]
MTPSSSQPAATSLPLEGAGPVWDNEHELVLEKKGQRHVFRCGPGEESALLNQLALMVDDPKNNLDWFDAAVLSHHMGLRMRRRLEDKRKP